MSAVLRRFQQKNKKKTKYTAVISPRELIIDYLKPSSSATNVQRPKQIVIAFMHRQRRYECKSRKTETSLSDSFRTLVIWPTVLPGDLIAPIVTLYKNDKIDSFEDKEWTLIVEELSDSSKSRPLAAISINLRPFIAHNATIEVKLKLRPLQSEIKQCIVCVCFSSSPFAITKIGKHSQTTKCIEANKVENCVQVENEFITPIKEKNSQHKTVNSEIVEKIEINESPSLLPVNENFSNCITNTKKIEKHNSEDSLLSFPPLKENILDQKSDGNYVENGQSNNKVDLVLKKNENVDKIENYRLKIELQPTFLTNKDEKVETAEPQSVSLVMMELASLKKEREEKIKEKLENNSREKLREEACEIMNEAMHSLKDNSLVVHNNFSDTKKKPHSQLELKTLETYSPQINFRTFHKHQLSPFLQRKPQESPILPAFGTRSNKFNKNGADTADHNVVQPFYPKVEQFSVNLKYEEVRPEEKVTPVRKIVTKFEKDLRNSTTNIANDLEQISERIAEVERLDSYIENKMRNVVPESENERKLIGQHLKLLTEKDALVRRQDYLNILIDLKETASEIENLQKLVNEVTTDELLHTNKTGKLMTELKELIDKKNELTHTLIDKEAEEEEESERGKRLIQQSQCFKRGTVEPLSASKRIFNWFNTPKSSK